MRKLSSFTKAFLSRLPTNPLLPALPVKLRLPAPATPATEVIRIRRLTRVDIDDAIAQMGPIRSREQMQDEIAALCLDSIDILMKRRQQRRNQTGRS